MQKSIKFFIMMLAAFLARVKPVSTMANPACMKNTKAAATIVQQRQRVSDFLGSEQSSSCDRKQRSIRAAVRLHLAGRQSHWGTWLLSFWIIVVLMLFDSPKGTVLLKRHYPESGARTPHQIYSKRDMQQTPTRLRTGSPNPKDPFS